MISLLWVSYASTKAPCASLNLLRLYIDRNIPPPSAANVPKAESMGAIAPSREVMAPAIGRLNPVIPEVIVRAREDSRPFTLAESRVSIEPPTMSAPTALTSAHRALAIPFGPMPTMIPPSV